MVGAGLVFYFIFILEREDKGKGPVFPFPRLDLFSNFVSSREESSTGLPLRGLAPRPVTMTVGYVVAVCLLPYGRDLWFYPPLGLCRKMQNEEYIILYSAQVPT